MSDSPVLYIVAGAAPPVLGIATLLAEVRDRGWDPCLTLTPAAASWLENGLDALAVVAGRTPRTRDRRPGEDRPFPTPDALLACPLTFNTLNKWTLGISDNVALGTLAEALGAGLPTVAVPWFKETLAAHPAYPGSIETLHARGVSIHLGPDGRPHSGDDPMDWATIASALPRIG
ncbi:flavoprotein [Embleya sp. NBC_00896]|uniref:flavoprotein n=1 Tax=Embleya sp. NBC_00896 TaxID=2975961 RepID=UPI002F90789A|nr:flavoprotein [Embleya sp. NBC_00896]